MPTYHTYKDPLPSALQDPSAITWENPADWPKSYRYIPAHDIYQGLHPPAPVYQATQTQTQTPYLYYGQAQQQSTNGYYVNGTYIPMPTGSTSSPYYSSYLNTASCYYPKPSSSFSTPYNPDDQSQQYYTSYQPSTYQWWIAPTQPTMIPMPTCPSSHTAQVAAAAAANATLAAMPAGPSYFVGTTQADIMAQQAFMMANMGAPNPPPTQLAPYKPAVGQQFWCKELDGSWTLRTHSDIAVGEVSPGHWEKHATSGYFYWVRQMS